MSANRPVTNDDIKWERKASSSNNVVNERKENGPLVVYGRKMTAWKTYITPKDIQLLRLQGKSKVKNTQSTLQQSEAFSCLPADVMNSLQENFTTSDDVNSIDTDLELDVRGNRCLNTENQEESITETSDICDELERILIEGEDMEIETGEIETPVLACAYLVSKLKDIDTRRKKAKWTNLDEENLKCLLTSSPEIVMKSFTKEELVICIQSLN